MGTQVILQIMEQEGFLVQKKPILLQRHQTLSPMAIQMAKKELVTVLQVKTKTNQIRIIQMEAPVKKEMTQIQLQKKKALKVQLVPMDKNHNQQTRISILISQFPSTATKMIQM